MPQNIIENPTYNFKWKDLRILGRESIEEKIAQAKCQVSENDLAFQFQQALYIDFDSIFKKLICYNEAYSIIDL